MLFGALIDSTCRLWQMDSSSSCHGSGRRSGSCLLFNTDQLRWRTYGVALGIQLVQLLFTVLLYFTVRRRFHSNEVISKQVSSTKSPALPTDNDGDQPPTIGETDLVEMTEDQVTPNNLLNAPQSLP